MTAPMIQSMSTIFTAIYQEGEYWSRVLNFPVRMTFFFFDVYMVGEEPPSFAHLFAYTNFIFVGEALKNPLFWYIEEKQLLAGSIGLLFLLIFSPSLSAFYQGQHCNGQKPTFRNIQLTVENKVLLFEGCVPSGMFVIN